ncbi:MAG: protein-export chaperone SecB [Bacteroidales bacterium]|nr:protein-export chaperone SecB [Bacteroidales bacterium]
MESGFRIDNIILLNVDFSRVNNVVFEGDIQNKLDIHTDVAVKDNQVIVGEEVSVIQTFQNVEQVKIRVKMVGMFTRVGESEINDLDAFGRVNGAAIIFPFIREVITNTSIKAGLPAIIIPPVNFTKNPEPAKPEE